jgi:hypothetical protein
MQKEHAVSGLRRISFVLVETRVEHLHTIHECFVHAVSRSAYITMGNGLASCTHYIKLAKWLLQKMVETCMLLVEKLVPPCRWMIPRWRVMETCMLLVETD